MRTHFQSPSNLALVVILMAAFGSPALAENFTADQVPPVSQEPSAYKEPLAGSEPSAYKEPSADREPSAHKQPPATKNISTPSAQRTEKALRDQIRINNQFQPLFKIVTDELANNQALHLANPAVYAKFINTNVKPMWDVASTTSALIGKERFHALAFPQQRALVRAVDKTLVRYAFEGLEHYSGQRFEVVDTVISKQGNLGWVQVEMQSPIIPDLNLDLLIKRTDSGSWKAVDLRFKGITYVAVKKHQYREIIEEQGIQALIDTLIKKNDEFFSRICAQVAPEQKVKPPC